MKALTLWPPWGSLVAHGLKTIETRSWSTTYRGELAVHQARRNVPLSQWPNGSARTLWPHVIGVPLEGDPPGAMFDPDDVREAVPRGYVVATCRLLDVLPIVSHPDPLPKGKPCVGLDEDGDVRIWRPSTMGEHALHVGAAGWPHPGDPALPENEAWFGDYTTGRFAWLLADVKPLEEPIPAKGRQQLWEWADA